ncbi:MAG: 3'-5' exoribonuclease [Clostridia bacterium]|nr:3'-5' exoribonuclease [Clostridia bacterium]
MKNSCDKLLDHLKNYYPTLGDVRLNSATLSGNDISVSLVSDVAVSSYEKEMVASEIQKQLGGYNVTVSCHKSVCDADLAKRAVIAYIKEHCNAVMHAVSEDKVKIICAGKKVRYSLSVIEGVADYLKRTSVISDLNESLSRQYSNDFDGEVIISNEVEVIPDYVITTVNESDLTDLKVRKFKVCDVVRCCDVEFYDEATCIEDGEEVLGKAIFAGKVVEIEERESKKGNKYYRITLDDKTGKITGSFFTADKQKLLKIEKIKADSVIIVRGEIEDFNGRPSFIIKGFHFCDFPSGYVPEPKPSKPIPEKYVIVTPEPCEVTEQTDLFTQKTELPEKVKNTEYVVVDIETTGTDITSDKITEIGAVRIKNGVICESFQTLIDPEVPLSKRIVELTGITDEMLEGKPKIHEVYPDFVKFLGTSVFIAHYADFDYRFLKKVGQEFGYFIRNDYIDTLAVSRKVLPWLSNHKLNTVCEHFKIEFRHHRALSDAFATAEAFLEMARLKK